MSDIDDKLAMFIEATGPEPVDTTDAPEPVDTDTDTDKPKKRKPKKAKEPYRLVIKRAIQENKKDKDNPNKPVIEYDHAASLPKRIQLVEWMRIEAEERADVRQVSVLDILLAGLRRELIGEQQQATRQGEYDPEESQYLQSADWIEWDEIDRLPPDHLESIAHETRKALNYPIFCPNSGRFYVYDGRKWTNTHKHYIESEGVRAFDRARPKGNGDGVMAKVKDIIKRLEIKGAILPDRSMNDRVNYVNLANGRLCLENWRVQRHRKSDLCTRVIDVDVTTDTLEAIRTKTTEELLDEAPKFKQFLLTTFKGYVEPMKTIKLVQEMIGYIFTPNCYAHKGFFLVGNGRNGKSVLCDIITGLVGTDSVSHINFGDLCDDSKLALMSDKAVNVCNDAAAVKFSSKKSSDKFKSITAGDPITFRDIYEKAQNRKLPTKIIFSLNHMPEISDDSHGFASRILAIPFNNEFADHEQIKGLADQIVSEELTAIAMFALQGLLDLQRRDYCFVPCEDSKRETGQYLEYIDQFGRFIEKYMVAQTNEDEPLCIPVDEFFERYRQYLNDRDYKEELNDAQRARLGRRIAKMQERARNRFFKKGRGPRDPNNFNKRPSIYYGVDCHYMGTDENTASVEF